MTSIAIAVASVLLCQTPGGSTAEAQPAPAVEAAPAPAPSTWSGTVGLSFISLTGNARAITFGAQAAVERKIPDWIFGLKANAAYGQGRSVGSSDTQVLALSAALQLRVDRRISQLVSVYVLGGIETDHVKSVEAREYGEAGVGLTWIDIKEGDFSKVLLRTDLGFRYANESRFQYYPTHLKEPSVTLAAPRFAVAFRYALNKGLIFTEDAEILPNVTGDARVLVNSQSKLSTHLTEILSLGVGFLVKFDSAPAPNSVNTDTALTVGLEVAF